MAQSLFTAGERFIKARQADVYQVKLPEEFRSPGDALDILVEVTLSYKAQPRRTRRNRRKYLWVVIQLAPIEHEQSA